MLSTVKISFIRTFSQKISAAAKPSKASKGPARFSKSLRDKFSNFVFSTMADSPEHGAKLMQYRKDVKEIGDRVRQLKADGAAKSEIDRTVYELKARKKKLEDFELELTPREAFFDRVKLEDLLKRRFFYDQSFAIYGGVAGLYDFGPMGCALKANMIQKWRNHFILAEGMLEVECSTLTPEEVLKTSGHVERFTDWMCKDVTTGACLRADHLIKENAEALIKHKSTSVDKKAELEKILSQLDGYDDKDMERIIRQFDFKSPITGNDITAPVKFNLMFPTQIGPTCDFVAYLRPETAQGIFINFKRLLEFNEGKLPFAAAQIGAGFRNEISPRQGLIRVREFTMCEIEHFVDPEYKDHLRFGQVANLELVLFPAAYQMDGKSTVRMRVGEAVAAKIIDNETLGYYMARTHLYLIGVGVDPTRLRFRQHMPNEMAHYAKDCWDAECLTSYGWIECVGNADRACYDLDCHSKATNTRLAAEKSLKQPQKVNVVEAVAKKAPIGKAFKADANKVIKAINELSIPQMDEIEKAWSESKSYPLITADGVTVELTKELIDIKRYEKTLYVQEVVPSVIEPSFGIGRIMYTVLEHAFRQREGDEKRCYLEIPATIAPIKCSILPISNKDCLTPVIDAVQEQLTRYELATKLDNSSSASIGKRYARTDEIGVPFAVTIDFESVKEPQTVTLRHAASMQQIRLEVSKVGETVVNLVSGRSTWSDVTKKFPIFQVDESDK